MSAELTKPQTAHAAPTQVMRDTGVSARPSAGPAPGSDAASAALVFDGELAFVGSTAGIDRLLEAATVPAGTAWRACPWRFAADALEEEARRALDGRASGRCTVTAADGRCWQVLLQAVRGDGDGRSHTHLLLVFECDDQGATASGSVRPEALASGPAALCLLDGEGEVLAASEAFADLSRTARAAIVGMSFADLADGAFARALGDGALAAMRRGAQPSLRAPFALRSPDGRIRTGVVTLRYLAGTRPMLLLTTAETPPTDATPPGTATRAALDLLPEASLIVDAGGCIRLVNRTAVELFGWPAAALDGMKLESVFPHLPAESPDGRFDPFATRAACPPEKPLPMRGRTRDGRDLPLDISLEPVTYEGRTATLLRAWPGAAPGSSEARLRAVLDRLPVAFVMLDRDGRIRFANDFALALWGRDRRDILQEDAFDLLCPAGEAERLRGRFERAIAAERLPDKPEFEFPLVDPDGRRRVVAWQAAADRDHEGRIVGVQLTGLDVTGQRERDRRLEADRADAEEADALKSRVLAAAGRDLQQPLQTLSLLHGIMARHVNDEPTRAALTTLGSVVEAMSSAFEVLLDVGRLESLPIEARLANVPLAPLLRDAATRFANLAANRGVELRIVPTAAVVRSDRALLEPLLNELLAKAIRHATGGRILVGCRRRDREIRLGVVTSRAGVSLEQLRFLVEQMETADDEAPRGRRFGLDVVRPLTRLAGHRLEVNLKIGGGAGFTVVLPRGEPRPLVEPTVARTPAGAAGSLVLVLADDPSVGDVVGQLFALEGFRVERAQTAAAAMAQRADGAKPPDLLVVDESAAGTAPVLRAVRSLRTRFGARVPTLVLTTRAVPQGSDDLAAEAVRLLHKPVTAEALLALAADLLGSPAAEPAGALAEAPGRWSQTGTVVGLVSGDPDTRAALSGILGRVDRPVAAADEVDALAAATADSPPLCVILDLDSLTPDASLELMERAARRFDAPQIVLIDRADVSLAVRAVRAGAFDVLAKPVREDVLPGAVLLASREHRRRRRREDDSLVAHHRLADLTPREREVLDLLVAGAANKEIAARLGISPRTVENHRARIMEKTQAASLAELVRLAAAVPYER